MPEFCAHVFSSVSVCARVHVSACVCEHIRNVGMHVCVSKFVCAGTCACVLYHLIDSALRLWCKLACFTTVVPRALLPASCRQEANWSKEEKLMSTYCFGRFILLNTTA